MVYGFPVEGTMDRKKRCCHCHRVLDLNPRIKNQKFCHRKICQRERKRRWQQQKMATDPDYRKNQRSAQINWLEAHPDYWHNYRCRHEKYCDRNRLLQRKRDANRRSRNLAKMDALKEEKGVIPGCYYYLMPVSADLAKMDASVQKVLLIPGGYENYATSCKEGLNVQANRCRLGCMQKETKDNDPATVPREGPQN